MLGGLKTIKTMRGVNQINIPAGVQYDDTIKLNLSNKIKKNMKIIIIIPDIIS